MLSFLQSVNRLYQGPRNVKYNLDRIIKLTNILGRPQDSFKAFHVAGTNGKGSTCAFISQILIEAKIPNGFHISPHLVDIRERIQINQKQISESNFIKLEAEIYKASQGLEASFFEKLTALWMLAFAEANLPYAVVEVGLGGRLDSSNIVNPIACGITRISKDHCHILGDTLGQIAYEKAGIIKKNIPVVIDQNNFHNPEISKIISEKALENNSEIICSDIIKNKSNISNINLGLKGDHQINNAAIAVGMIEASKILEKYKIENKNQIIKQALKKTSFPGRYQTISDKPLTIIDGAHNDNAARFLGQAVKQDKRLENKTPVLLIGFSKNHDPKSFLENLLTDLKKPIKIFLASYRHELLTPVDKILNNLKSSSDLNFKVGNLKQAQEYAKKNNGFVLVTGSLYLLGEILKEKI